MLADAMANDCYCISRRYINRRPIRLRERSGIKSLKTTSSFTWPTLLSRRYIVVWIRENYVAV